MPLLEATDRGLYCRSGDFHIDPWAPVPRAVVTHAHGDHLAWGCDAYLVSLAGRDLASARLGGREVESLRYGETRSINGVTVSFHPAGHILGSAQVRVEHHGEVWVVSGDYKTEPDPTCAAFELQRADVFVTESTFGLPIYRWPDPKSVGAEIGAWIDSNRAAGLASIILAYPLGKAQRLMSLLGPLDVPIWTHGAVEAMTSHYRAAGITLPATTPVSQTDRSTRFADGVVIGPPSVAGSPWLRRFGISSSAFASGWMQVRGARRRRNVDRGFVLSDHADWDDLLRTIHGTGASRVFTTHGFTEQLARYLGEQGLDTGVLPTRWEGERDDVAIDAADAE